MDIARLGLKSNGNRPFDGRESRYMMFTKLLLWLSYLVPELYILSL